MDKTVSHLRQQGFRLTPQRLTILQILEESGQHLTPLEVFQIARQMLPGITEATVYRNLNFLTEQGLALAAHIGSGQLVYEIAGHAHHHLICRECGHSLEIDHEALEPLYQQLKNQTGFQIDSLHATFFGLCQSCLASQGTT
jgi:Fe2+ or Zn2+ uptake regulation protein